MSSSSLSSSLCSSVSFSAHLALSNFGGVYVTDAEDDSPLPLPGGIATAVETGLGAPKKDVMLALGLVFLASAAASSAAFLLIDISAGRLNRMEDSLNEFWVEFERLHLSLYHFYTACS